MSKIITAPRKLTPAEQQVRLVEIKIQRIYALGDVLTLRQRSSIIRALLQKLVDRRYIDATPTT